MKKFLICLLGVMLIFSVGCAEGEPDSGFSSLSEKLESVIEKPDSEEIEESVTEESNGEESKDNNSSSKGEDESGEDNDVTEKGPSLEEDDWTPFI